MSGIDPVRSGAESAAAIRVTDLRRVFAGPDGPRAVLDGVDLSVDAGACVAVVGPSGCGKTTLLNALGGLDDGWTGTVEVAGIALASASEGERARLRSRYVGFVFQDYALLEDLSALDNVALPRYLLRLDTARRARRRAAELLDRVGLTAHAGARVGLLSGGERQRVALARALVNDPSVVLCDEPTGNLDESTGARLVELLDAIGRERGLTVVAATHDRALEARADRVVWLADGKLGSEPPP